MNLASAFPGCTVRALTEADIPEMYALCAGNPLYYEHFGAPLTLESLRADLTVLPPDTAPEQKHFVGLWRADKLIALLDLICDYPAPGTAYIGWFILTSLFGNLCPPGIQTQSPATAPKPSCQKAGVRTSASLPCS